MAKGIQKSFLVPASRATCVAKKLKGKVSTKAERAIANANESEIPAKELDAVRKQIGDAGAACK